MKHLKLVLFMLSTGLFMGLAGAIAQAATLGANSPLNNDSTPVGAHVFYLRRTAVTGVSPDVNLAVYYPANTTAASWNSAYLQIASGNDPNSDSHICDAEPEQPSGNSVADYIEITVSTSKDSNTYRIDRKNVCKQQPSSFGGVSNGGINVLFEKYHLPQMPTNVDSETGLYKVRMSIKYTNNAPQNSAGAVRFKVQSSLGGAKIGPTGAPGGDGFSTTPGAFSFPIITDYPDSNNPPTSIRVPFGLACSEVAPKDGDLVRVGVYDADNYSAAFNYDVTFRVRDIITNTYLNMEQPQGGSLVNNTTMKPGDPNAQSTEKNEATVGVRLASQPDHKYELIINGIDVRNAIDVYTPKDSIYGDPDTCPANDSGKFKIVGTSQVNGTTGTVTLQPNVAASFTHRLKNVGGATSPSVQYAIRGSTQLGNIDSTTKSHTFPSQGLVDTGPDSFKFKSTDKDGTKYCEHVAWQPYSTDDTDTPHTSNDVCVQLDNPAVPCKSTDSTCCKSKGTCPPGDCNTDPTSCPGGDCSTDPTKCPPTTTQPQPTNMPITLTPVVNGGPEVETQSSATFTGYVNVSGFPKEEVGGWPYSEVAVNGGVYVVPPTQETYPATTTGGGGASAPTQTCTSGFTLDYSHYPPTITAVCKGGFTYTCGGAPASPSGTCPSIYDHYCQGTLAGEDYNPTYDCQYKYTCPVPNGQVYYQQSPPDCNVERCAYENNTQGSTGKTQDQCEKRCDMGAGARPPLYDNGDMNCYMQPSFTLHCTWSVYNSSGTASDIEFDDIVTQDGNYCNHAPDSYQIQTSAIGTMACAQLNVDQPTGWTPSSPTPGYGSTDNGSSFHQINNYTWSRQGNPANACSKVVGYPYVKVYDGDVRVGGGVGESANPSATAASCSSNNANIFTNARPDASGAYVGAGAEGAAFAGNIITGFISGQNNSAFQSTDPGSPPKSLSFANTGADTFGGHYGGTPGGCTGFYEETTKNVDAQVLPSSSLGATTLATSQKMIRYYDGDVHITGDIAYTDNWTKIVDIPLFQLVVKGNIYIDSGVSRIDGLYVAVQSKGNPSGTGNIYTCGGQTQTRAGDCSTQLVVNGSLAANRIYFERDCGSLTYATPNEPTTLTPGSDAEQCSSSSHAAEVINYSPEQWIRSADSSSSSIYNSISTLPPIL